MKNFEIYWTNEPYYNYTNEIYWDLDKMKIYLHTRRYGSMILSKIMCCQVHLGHKFSPFCGKPIIEVAFEFVYKKNGLWCGRCMVVSLSFGCTHWMGFSHGFFGAWWTWLLLLNSIHCLAIAVHWIGILTVLFI